MGTSLPSPQGETAPTGLGAWAAPPSAFVTTYWSVVLAAGRQDTTRAHDALATLKILPAEASRDPAFAERFTREARALARLNHPNIVAVYDIGQADGFYYFLMEFIDGATLRHLIADGGLTPREALAIVPQICEALQYAHGRGTVNLAAPRLMQF